MDIKNNKENELRDNSYELNLRYIDSVSETKSIFACTICNEVYELDNKVVNNKDFTCNICKNREKLDQLKEKNISLKCKFKDKRVYEYNKCNHYVIISDDKIIDPDMKCEECMINNLENKANNFGLELLIKIDDEYGWYKFNKCNHLQKISFSDINNNINCKTCEIEKLKKEAREVGLQYIEAINSDYGLYRCIKCNVEHKFSFNDVANKNLKVLCEKCMSLVN